MIQILPQLPETEVIRRFRLSENTNICSHFNTREIKEFLCDVQ